MYCVIDFVPCTEMARLYGQRFAFVPYGLIMTTVRPPAGDFVSHLFAHYRDRNAKRRRKIISHDVCVTDRMMGSQLLRVLLTARVAEAHRRVVEKRDAIQSWNAPVCKWIIGSEWNVSRNMYTVHVGSNMPDPSVKLAAKLLRYAHRSQLPLRPHFRSIWLSETKMTAYPDLPVFANKSSIAKLRPFKINISFIQSQFNSSGSHPLFRLHFLLIVAPGLASSRIYIEQHAVCCFWLVRSFMPNV